MSLLGYAQVSGPTIEYKLAFPIIKLYCIIIIIPGSGLSPSGSLWLLTAATTTTTTTAQDKDDLFCTYCTSHSLIMETFGIEIGSHEDVPGWFEGGEDAFGPPLFAFERPCCSLSPGSTRVCRPESSCRLLLVAA